MVNVEQHQGGRTRRAQPQRLGAHFGEVPAVGQLGEHVEVGHDAQLPVGFAQVVFGALVGEQQADVDRENDTGHQRHEHGRLLDVVRRGDGCPPAAQARQQARDLDQGGGHQVQQQGLEIRALTPVADGVDLPAGIQEKTDAHQAEAGHARAQIVGQAVVEGEQGPKPQRQQGCVHPVRGAEIGAGVELPHARQHGHGPLQPQQHRQGGQPRVGIA